MGREDKARGMGYQDPGPTNSGDENSSLSARRARLRGTLAKQAVPPDPYVPDPYLSSTPQPDPAQATANDEEQASSQAAPAQAPPAQREQRRNNQPKGGSNGSSDPGQSTRSEDPASPTQQAQALLQAQMMQAHAQGKSQVDTSAPQDSYEYGVSPALHTVPNPDATREMDAVFLQQPSAQPLTAPPDNSYTYGIEPAATAPSSGFPTYPTAPTPEPTPAVAPASPTSVVSPPTPAVDTITTNDNKSAPPDPSSTLSKELQTQQVEILNNIDQAMNACAMNLSALQKMAGEQTDTLKGLSETMQNQSLFEMGLNLNSIMESLSAALEPMKAVGELVPAIDQLVTVLETKQSQEEKPSPKLTADQLVTNLADQLCNGLIDPWTFKCAYMAVYPSEHPADLLHRLVDLLGTQRLSGDLFRSAYDAVQAAEPPRGLSDESGQVRTVVKVVPDEALLAEIEELKKVNEQLRKSQEEHQKRIEDYTKRVDEHPGRMDEIQKRLEQRETEFAELIAAKDTELQEAQELLNSRWEEFNTRYDELTETLHKRDELIAEKEAELARKETENKQLKIQMDELRDQTKDMVADLQKQLLARPKEEPKPAAQSFFDPAPTGGAGGGSLFDPNTQRQQLFQPGAAPAAQLPEPPPQPPAPAMVPAPQPQPMQQPMQPPMQPQPMQQPAAAQTAAQPQPPPAPAAGGAGATTQAIPRPAQTTAPIFGAGSYGSGVRAQVFEVIVRQALAGAPWREICAGPMQVNNISPEEVEAEVKRRQALLGKK